MKHLIAATCALTLGGASSLAVAHHSFAMFDNQKEVSLVGTVTQFQWTNPHCWIQLAVPATGAAGKEMEWSIEGQSPNALVRQGWTRSSIKTGDKATVVIHPLKDGSAGGSVVRVIINGTEVGAEGARRP